MVLLATKEKGNCFIVFFFCILNALNPNLCCGSQVLHRHCLCLPAFRNVLCRLSFLAYMRVLFVQGSCSVCTLQIFHSNSWFFTYGKVMVTPDLSFVFHDLEIFFFFLALVFYKFCWLPKYFLSLPKSCRKRWM